MVKRGTPLKWRLKLCEFQYGKSLSVSGINLIGWRGTDCHRGKGKIRGEKAKRKAKTTEESGC